MRDDLKPKKRNLNGERVVLVDDVLTTGATTSSESEKTCKQEGDEAVGVWGGSRPRFAPQLT